MIKTIKQFMPRISDTERTALECGTVSIDGDIFAGNAPRKIRLADKTYLNKIELDYLDNKVPELIRLHEKHGYTDNRDVHPEVWQYIKDHKFFAMIIPRTFGGLGFTPTAQSLIVSKIASSGHSPLATIIMVPNSLGPGELLMHYGTPAQTEHYLPRLASGELIPCFGLTGVQNGSDATTKIDEAKVVGTGQYEVTLNKRYITLAPVADLIGLAVKIEGHITLFLVERDHPGLEIGERHNPLGQQFMNGTVKGTIQLTDEHVLGGKEYIGQGWRMLVECLSVGRAISLPALGTAVCARSALAAGAYSQARSQFGMPICRMEGIQEPLADIAYQAFLTMTTQELINGELQRGESPSALSAMWKYQSTERGRIAVNHAMDILAGAAIQEGPSNVIANCYKGMPIAITVEGANILSRSLVTFGGGLMRSHPHLKDLVDAIEAEDTGAFLKHLAKIVAHTGRNFGKAVFRDKNALFAFTANMVLTLGAKYKRSEYISARMADIFSIRVMEAGVLATKDSALRDYALKRLHNEEAKAYREVVAELPLLSGSAVRLAKSTLFHGDKHVSAEDNRVASQYISNKSDFANELIEYVYASGRMQELIDSYQDEGLDDVVIEVDSE